MVMMAKDRPRIGAWLILLSWLLGAGPLTMGLEREDGHVFAAALFAVACSIWCLGHQLLSTSNRAIRVASFVVPALWLVNIVVGAILEVRWGGNLDWFPPVSVGILGIALAGCLISLRVRKRRSVTDLGTPPSP